MNLIHSPSDEDFSEPPFKAYWCTIDDFGYLWDIVVEGFEIQITESDGPSLPDKYAYFFTGNFKATAIANWQDPD